MRTTMRKMFLPLFGAIGALAAVATPALANDRYAERPPVMVSPDLSAPWVTQLGRAPGVVRSSRGYAVQPQWGQPQVRYRQVAPQGQYQVQPRVQYRQAQPQAGTDRVRTAAVPGRPVRRTVARPQINPIYLPQEVAFDGKEKPGTIIIDTTKNFLYLVGDNGKARRYGVGTGKPGFEWAGTHKVSQKREWPDWRPPSEMIAREKAKGRYLPTFLAGGIENPLGARALYLGSTLYRIHGTNQPWTIGGAVSSGCIRMRNEDVVDLYDRVKVGTTVVVM